ncbi:coiled-coil domain-containing protein 124-like [Euwallacea fornicatus]|uniref:coiled-coil domain-containing protein 124-like n=1 Tax=Euwallacea fornicatus TaxID=995702 RepID=UPI00338D6BF0
MPKKFATENTKAVAARERKKAAKDIENQRREQALEDAKWRDDDKQVLKKQQKKEAEERKRQEQLQRKAEAKALLEQEMSSGFVKTVKAPPPVKITRAQIQAKKEEFPKKREVEKTTETHLDAPLVENLNRLQIDGEEARNIEEAIKILGGTIDDIDKHPEKRMKAAYTSYEETRLKELKLEYPSLKLSQLKQMIFKEWQKSPENPLNKV